MITARPAPALRQPRIWGMSAVRPRMGERFSRDISMTNWTETYRGAVPPWQCDVTEHFTVGYYFDRLEEAEANLADALGIGDAVAPRRPAAPARCAVSHANCAPAPASMSRARRLASIPGLLRLGHRFVDSANGEVVTWFDERWDLAAAPLTPQQRERDRSRGSRPGTVRRPRRGLSRSRPTVSSRPRADGSSTADLDAAGHFALGAIVLRFSNASGQLGAAVGMDSAFMQQQRRGFSTFELSLRLSGALPLDAPYLIETGIGHLGNSSLRMIHRMTDPRTGVEDRAARSIWRQPRSRCAPPSAMAG